MKISVGSPSPFYTFDLARQLDRLGHLERLYTAYPSWRVDGLPRRRVSTFPWLMGPVMLANRIGLSGIRDQLNFPMIRTYDDWMARRLVPCDALHCLSSFGLQSHRAARERFGALTICDRGSSHIAFQDEILRDEYARLGLAYEGTDPRVVEREIAEYEYCDLIFVPTTFVRRTFTERGIAAEKLRVNPYGVDLAIFHPEPKWDKTFRVLFAGAATPRKGLQYLLEAFAGLGIRDAELCVMGPVDRQMRPILARYANQVRLTGKLSRAATQQQYSQSSVLVLPSIEEGLALVQAQAMACGVPVIATENSGAADLFSDGVEGFIVPIRDSGAIREKLLTLYENPAMRDAMGQAALARVRDRGGWDDYGQRAVKCYSDALAKRSAGR